MRHLVILLVAASVAGSGPPWPPLTPNPCSLGIIGARRCDQDLLRVCGSWSAWSPSKCDECVGRQRRVRSECGNNDATAASGPVIEEQQQQRACFSPVLCTSSSRRREAISPAAISQSPPLRPPEALTASFVPYLHVGAWSACQTPEKNLRSEKDRKSRKKKRRNRKRPKRNNFQPPELPPLPLPPPPVEPGKGAPPPPPPWSPALPADLEISFVAESVSPPQHGVQRRDVVCRGQDGESLPFRVCVDGHTQTVVPTDVRSCVKPRRCITSTWTPWVEDVNFPCGGNDRRLGRLTRQRKIEQLPLGVHVCPHLIDVKPRLASAAQATPSNATTTACQPQYQLVASGWSDCQVVDLSGNRAICGGGLQDRNISCLSLNQNRLPQPVDFGFCSHLPQLARLQRCFVACADSCRHLGSWSDWSKCIPHDCSTPAAKGTLTSAASKPTLPAHLPGRQTRRRTPLQSSSACPHLEESRDCSISSCYSWRLEKRDECFLPRGRDCGSGGTRKILFACIDYEGNPAPVEACSRLSQPPYEEDCHIQCPMENIVSPWSAWSACPPSCSRGRIRSTSFRNRSLLALGMESTFSSDGSLSEVRPCPASSECDTFHWRAGLWSSCVVLKPRSNCGLGAKRRDAICVMFNEPDQVVGRIVSDWRCQGLKAPLLEENCVKACPQDCQLTEWSAWTSCDEHCVNASPGASGSIGTTSTMASFTVIMNTQSRYRQVLQWPRNGGLQCARLIDVRPCPLQSSKSCQSTRRWWRPQPWSSCLLPPGKSCGEGIRARGLDCLSSGNSHVDMRRCLDDEWLMSQPWPSQYQRCWVDCVSKCVKGAWSSWSSCRQGCPSVRSRSRPLSNPVECASTPALEEEACPCQNYRSVPSGSWSDCITNGSLCGIGKRYRRLHCLDMDNQLAEPIMCGGNSSYQSEPCTVSCPIDCQMSAWSEWGLCDSNCAYGLKNRSSKVVRLASVGGRPCPGPSVQYALCNYPCENFSWLTSPWSECRLVNDAAKKCGRGRKSRTIRCVEKTKLEPLDVPSHYCDPEEKPSHSRDCQIYCPGECVVSEWTEWSNCLSKDCLESGFQRRKRSWLRTAAVAAAATTSSKCSQHLEESRACDAACFFGYEWSLTPWSSCQPLGDSACGQGKRSRGLRCIRLTDGRAVKETHCRGQPRPQTELETPCPTDCPLDCEVSAWTQWNESQCLCGRQERNMTRWRVVTTQASPSGRPCPAVMSQSKPCPSRPCYSWLMSTSACDLQGAACGVGTVIRNVSCVRGSLGDRPHDPEDVNRCSREEVFIKDEPTCFKPCPTDCVLSDWSSWSECRGPCVGSRTLGARTRSRSVMRQAVRPHGQCLSELVERQPCSLSPCFSYSASIIDDKVECIRSDGLIVEHDDFCGGSISQRPRQPHFDVLSHDDCQPHCKVVHSECVDKKCRCQSGYLPTYLPAPILSSRPPTLVFCQSLSEVAVVLKSNAAMANNASGLDVASDQNGTDTIPDIISYYPKDDFSDLNPWMLAMIGIGCVFIAFVGVSIYLMCKSTNQESVRVPKN